MFMSRPGRRRSWGFRHGLGFLTGELLSLTVPGGRGDGGSAPPLVLVLVLVLVSEYYKELLS